MEPSALLLGQALALSGLIGATGGYAGLIRRRRVADELLTVALATRAAVERVDRAMVLGRIDHTFIRSSYVQRSRYPGQRSRP